MPKGHSFKVGSTSIRAQRTGSLVLTLNDEENMDMNAHQGEGYSQGGNSGEGYQEDGAYQGFFQPSFTQDEPNSRDQQTYEQYQPSQYQDESIHNEEQPPITPFFSSFYEDEVTFHATLMDSDEEQDPVKERTRTNPSKELNSLQIRFNAFKYRPQKSGLDLRKKIMMRQQKQTSGKEEETIVEEPTREEVPKQVRVISQQQIEGLFANPFSYVERLVEEEAVKKENAEREKVKERKKQSVIENAGNLQGTQSGVEGGRMQGGRMQGGQESILPPSMSIPPAPSQQDIQGILASQVVELQDKVKSLETELRVPHASQDTSQEVRQLQQGVVFNKYTRNGKRHPRLIWIK